MIWQKVCGNIANYTSFLMLLFFGCWGLVLGFRGGKGYEAKRKGGNKSASVCAVSALFTVLFIWFWQPKAVFLL